MNAIYIPRAGEIGEEEKRIHIELEPVRAPREVPAAPVPAEPVPA